MTDLAKSASHGKAKSKAAPRGGKTQAPLKAATLLRAAIAEKPGVFLNSELEVSYGRGKEHIARGRVHRFKDIDSLIESLDAPKSKA